MDAGLCVLQNLYTSTYILQWIHFWCISQGSLLPPNEKLQNWACAMCISMQHVHYTKSCVVKFFGLLQNITPMKISMYTVERVVNRVLLMCDTTGFIFLFRWTQPRVSSGTKVLMSLA